MDNELFRRGDKSDLRELKDIILRSGFDSLVKVDFLEYLDAEQEEGMLKLGTLVYDFLNADDAIEDCGQYSDIHEWVNAVLEKLQPSIKGYSKKQVDLAIMLILQEKMLRDISYKPTLNIFVEEYRKGDGVF